MKNATSSSREEKLDRRGIENYLESAGLPQRVAEEIAERVEDRVKDQKNQTRVNEQIDLEIKKLEESLQKAASTYRKKR